jgi:type IV pilus assembly protein PilE
MQINRERIMRRVHGFTLVELMVVVAIIAILAAFAVPAYSRYGYRARRTDGQELLLRIATAQERYYATYNRYGALTDLGYANPALSEKGFYSATLSLDTKAFLFTATAATVGVQQNDACGSLQLDSNGSKSPGAGDTSSNSNGSCW